MGEYSQVEAFLVRLDGAYRFKARRLNFMRLATVNREILYMRDNFNSLWSVSGEEYLLKTSDISLKGMRVILGIFAAPVEARAILNACREIEAFDRVHFNNFLSEKIRNSAAVKNLYSLFYAAEGECIERLVKEQIPYLEKYIPTFAAIESCDPQNIRLKRDDIDTIKNIIQLFDVIKDNFSKDIALFRRFQRDYRNLYRESLALGILGYGEISTVMHLVKGKMINRYFETEKIETTPWIWKRMPSLQSIDDVKNYEIAYREYRELLTNDVGIMVPAQTIRHFDNAGSYTVYAGQEKIEPVNVGNRLLRRCDVENSKRLFALVLGELKKLYDFNRQSSYYSIGLDGQISNWVLVPHNGAINYVGNNDTLLYIDTSTPLYRKNGHEQINAEIFIRNTPLFLRGIIRMFFLQEVLDRYYDVRSIIVDCIANLHKEKVSGLIGHFIPMANNFLKENEIPGTEITSDEVDKYYASDAFIWKFFQFSRKVDKFITEKIFRKKYTYRLPGAIER